MGCDISSGRSRYCKSQLGGIKNVYILPYTEYLRSQIVLSGLTITDFPTNGLYPLRVYHFEVTDATYTETQQDDLSFNQNFDFKLLSFFQKYTTDGTGNVEILLKKDARIIIEDNNGTYRMLGAYNGMVCTDLTRENGGAKADFVGFNVKYEGFEETPALFLSDLTLFEVEEYLLMEDGDYLLYEDNQYIALG